MLLFILLFAVLVMYHLSQPGAVVSVFTHVAWLVCLRCQCVVLCSESSAC